MRRLVLLTALILGVTFSGNAQNKDSELDRVFALLDRTSESFHSVQADFVSDTFQKATEDHIRDSGRLFFLRSEHKLEIAIDQNPQDPSHQKVVFKDGNAKIYHFRSKTTEEHPSGDNREEFEQYFSLGFGGSGSDLKRKFDVHYAGAESINGRATYKLELTPKSTKVRDMFNLIVLWIDQQTGMSVQQRMSMGKYNYRLVNYSKIVVNQKLPKQTFDPTKSTP